jgi:acyl-CoA thioester hydrolase
MNSTPQGIPQELSEFPVVVRLPVQWGDQDAFGHVNNTVYFRWFESARIAYLERLNLADKNSAEQLGPILAAIGCNYRRQLRYPDTVYVGTRITRVGRTSLTAEHKIWSDAQQAIVADGQSTLVVFDYSVNQPHAVPERVRSQIESLEGRTFS